MKNKILDLGCGKNKVNGSIGMDIASLNGVDIVHDLLSIPYPFKDQSFDIIYLRHVLEHFKIEDIKLILDECSRVLDFNGRLIITVPHVFSIAAYTDVTHKTFFTFNSGKFFDYNHTMSYYNKESNFKFNLIKIDCNLCWFDWKNRIFRKLDYLMSNFARYRILNALKKKENPSLADRIVKKSSYQFVEIKWIYKRCNL